MPDDEKKTRGPMSEDARIVQAKRKIQELDPAARSLVLTELDVADGEDDGPAIAARAKRHEDAARILAFTAPLSSDGRRTLLALVK